MKLVFAGGGTGGHLFPALALAEEFRSRVPGLEVVFVGGRGGIEERIVPARGYRLELLNVEGLKRKKGREKATALLRVSAATVKALRLLRAMRPDGVIGSGSYSSAPVVMAARILGIKTAVLEQNAVAGLTNKLLGRFVDRVYIAFEEAERYFSPSKTVLAGNPMRREIIERIRERAASVSERNRRFTILVFGGSQGATAINAAFLDAAEYLTDIWSGLRVIHQTGRKGFRFVKEAYGRKRLKAEVHDFIDSMEDAYSSADLVVCRAGATSLAEITAFGLAAILVPYPFASDDHQRVNAMSLSEKGAAVMIPQDRLTGRTLADAIRRFYERPGELKEVREKARALGRPGAAGAIVEDFMEILNRGRPVRSSARTGEVPG